MCCGSRRVRALRRLLDVWINHPLVDFPATIAIAVAVSLLLAATAEVHANGTLVLTGQVSSQKEGLMEGVVVGLQQINSGSMRVLGV